MKLLLDTHIWIWSLMTPKRLSKRVIRALRSENNELWLSSISVWELLIMIERQRITLGQDPQEWLDQALATAPIREAPVTFEIARVSRTIDLPHQDPADRFIAATAKVLDLALVTADQHLIKAKDWRVLANTG